MADWDSLFPPRRDPREELMHEAMSAIQFATEEQLVALKVFLQLMKKGQQNTPESPELVDALRRLSELLA